MSDTARHFSWAFAFVWACPMIGAYLWATWASEPRWGWRLLIAGTVQVVSLLVAHLLYGNASVR